jgi:hypothetical protein
MINDVIVHWLVTMLCVAVGIPWAKYLFNTLPHALIGVARPLGYAVIGVVVWGLAMIGLIPFNSGSVVFVAIGVGYLGLRWWCLSAVVHPIRGVLSDPWIMPSSTACCIHPAFRRWIHGCLG